MSKVTKWPLEQGSLLTECKEATLSSLSENSIFRTPPRPRGARPASQLPSLVFRALSACTDGHPQETPARRNPQTLTRDPPPCSHWVASSFLRPPIFFFSPSSTIGPRHCPSQIPTTAFASFSSLAGELLIHPRSKGYWVHLTVARALRGQAPPPAPTPPTKSLLSTSQASHSITELPPPGFIRDSSAPPSSHCSDALVALAERATCLGDALHEGSAECAEQGWQSLPAG